ncbi:MAG TPA: ArsR family transcriptional regulator [Mycobacteriales bacterium]|nr:ArsR family transcriptional regulator [Mycobacteriales bacterium]
MAVSPADRRTRVRVARLLLERGPQTAAALSAELGLTAAAVRRHLDAMLGEGAILAKPLRIFGPRTRGRPARVFELSDAGHAAMPNGYDDIAAAALRFLADTGGARAVEAFARVRVGELEARYRPTVEAARPADRPAALAEALSADGYAAGAREATAGVQLCQHHCPVQHVAEQFPQLCDAETEAFGRLLGTHIQRLATIAHGDGVCTTFIPAGRPAASARSTSGRTSS